MTLHRAAAVGVLCLLLAGTGAAATLTVTERGDAVAFRADLPFVVDDPRVNASVETCQAGDCRDAPVSSVTVTPGTGTVTVYATPQHSGRVTARVSLWTARGAAMASTETRLTPDYAPPNSSGAGTGPTGMAAGDASLLGLAVLAALVLVAGLRTARKRFPRVDPDRRPGFDRAQVRGPFRQIKDRVADQRDDDR